MANARRLARVGLAVALGVLGLGLVLVLGSAALAGDWYLASQPFIGLGLHLVVIGLALTAVFATLLVIVEPIGWLRVLALPAVVIVGGMWTLRLAGWTPLILGAAGRQRPTPDLLGDTATLLYSIPALMFLAIVATLLITTPLVVAKLSSRS
jgi:hypothetical protein